MHLGLTNGNTNTFDDNKMIQPSVISIEFLYDNKCKTPQVFANPKTLSDNQNLVNKIIGKVPNKAGKKYNENDLHKIYNEVREID